MNRFNAFLKNERNAGLVFLLVFFCQCLLYNYQHELFTRPHGYHVWRQTDGFCVAYNYYSVSMDFLHPRISQFISQDGMELAEFPIVYYLSAIGYQIFGFHEEIPRIVDLLLVFFGLWCLFRLLADVLGDHFYAILLSLFLFTSPVLIFYAITPMPDIAGMSLALAGLYYFYRYFKYEKALYLFLAFIFYALAGCIKPTSIISLFAIIAVLIVIKVADFRRLTSWPKINTRAIQQMFVFSIATVGVVIGWWIYVAYYRALHHTSYFQTNANPIWEVKKTEIVRMALHLIWTWTNHYFNLPMIALIAILALYSYVVHIKEAKIMFLSYTLFLIGCISYMLLFFPNFDVHDYYIIVVLPLFVATSFLFIKTVQDKFFDTFSSNRFKVTMLVLFLFNVAYAAHKTAVRNGDSGYDVNNHKQLTHIEPYLDTIGIHKNDFVIYWGDEAPNTAFYLMNRRGWGRWAMGGQLDEWKIDGFIKKGAAFLIIDQNQCKLDDRDRNTIYKYSAHKISDREGIQIYDLRVYR